MTCVLKLIKPTLSETTYALKLVTPVLSEMACVMRLMNVVPSVTASALKLTKPVIGEIACGPLNDEPTGRKRAEGLATDAVRAYQVPAAVSCAPPSVGATASWNGGIHFDADGESVMFAVSAAATPMPASPPSEFAMSPWRAFALLPM